MVGSVNGCRAHFLYSRCIIEHWVRDLDQVEIAKHVRTCLQVNFLSKRRPTQPFWQLSRPRVHGWPHGPAGLARPNLVGVGIERVGPSMYVVTGLVDVGVTFDLLSMRAFPQIRFNSILDRLPQTDTLSASL